MKTKPSIITRYLALACRIVVALLALPVCY